MSDNTSKKGILLLPPTMRFIVELSTWTWLILAGFKYSLSWYYAIFWVLAVVSIASLASLNYPGDKRDASAKQIGLTVPGWLRVSIEFISGSLGVTAAFFYVGLAGGIPQLTVTLVAFFLDRKRWMWMFGILAEPPDYVTIVLKKP